MILFCGRNEIARVKAAKSFERSLHESQNPLDWKVVETRLASVTDPAARADCCHLLGIDIAKQHRQTSTTANLGLAATIQIKILLDAEKDTTVVTPSSRCVQLSDISLSFFIWADVALVQSSWTKKT